MVSAKQVGAELRRATTLSVMSLTGAAAAAAVLSGIVLVFLFADSDRDRELRAWDERLGIVAETRAAALNDWIERQYGELGDLAENASLQLYMTEIARARSGAGSVTDASAQADYLRNLLAAAADRAGYAAPLRGPDIDANVDRVAVAGIALVDTAGAIVAATRGMPPLSGPGYTDLLAPGAGGRGFFDIRKTAGGDLVIGFSVPVHAVQADAGTAVPLGRVVGIRMVADGLFPILRQPGFSWKTAEIYLVRRSGDTVEFLSPRRGNRAPLTGARAIDADISAARAAQGGARFGIADDYEGVQTLFSARPLDAAPWMLVAELSRDEALGEGEARRITLIAAMLAGIALAVVAFVAIWRHGTSVRATEAADRYRDMAHRYEAQSEFLRLVADSQPHPMFIVDREGRYRFANRAAAQQAETSDTDMIGKSISNVLGPAEARRYGETNDSVLASGTMISQVHRTGANGDLRVVQAEYIPVANGPNFDDGVLVVEQDITSAVSEREHRAAALKQLVRTLLTVVDSRDPYAANHSMQVSVIARSIAEQMGLDEVQIETAETAGTLMNVGKLLVPAALLTRPGELLEDEKRQVRESIDSGAELLAEVPFDGPVVETLRQMTERWDGNGSPRGLAGADILVTARIVSVANAFVAILNPRAWRPGANFDDALEMLLDGCGTAFDRSVVAALINRLDNHGGREDWAHLPNAVPAA